VAFKHFIRRVIKRRKAIARELAHLIENFVEEVIDKDDGNAVRHLATCFGLVAAAGILGVRFGTLPWSKKFVIRCVKRCYRDARRGLRTETDLLREGLRTFQDRIEAKLLKVSDKKYHSKSSWKAADGYREKTNLGTKVTIRGEAFKDWFNDQRHPAIVLRWLHSRNGLSSKRSPCGTSTPAVTWAESQPLWPDGKRRRSIVIELRPGMLPQPKK
jgi:hypothetical protein